MAEHYEVGDIVKLKKPHPCGSPDYEKKMRNIVKKTRNTRKRACYKPFFMLE